MPEPQPFVSARAAGSAGRETVLAQVQARLREGEPIRAVVSVAKIFPPIDVVVVTPWRVVAGARRELVEHDREVWAVDLALEDVVELKVTGFMDNARFVLRDGSEVKVGNLMEGDDEGPLREALGMTSPQTDRADAAAPPASSSPGAPQATWELYDPPPPAHHRHRRR